MSTSIEQLIDRLTKAAIANPETMMRGKFFDETIIADGAHDGEGGYVIHYSLNGDLMSPEEIITSIEAKYPAPALTHDWNPGTKQP